MRGDRDPDWGDLQHFAAVARGGSIGAAARTLGVHHSTVLRRIASLEATLGARLFDRLPSGYALTAAGNALADRLDGVADVVAAAQRRLLGLGEAIEGPIRLEVPDVLLDALVMPLLAAFRRMHPGVTLQLVIVSRAAHGADADLALRLGDTGAAPLAGLEAAWCASRRYLADAGADRRPHEHRWVVAHGGTAFAAFDAWRHAHVGEERIAVRVDSLRAAADAIAGGLGVGLLPRPLATTREGLVELAAPIALPREPLALVVHPDAGGTARVRRLADFLAGRLAADPRLVR